MTRRPAPACPQALLALWFVVEDHDTLFVMSESVHFLGIGLLSYKLIRKKNCGGGWRAGGALRWAGGQRPAAGGLQGARPRRPAAAGQRMHAQGAPSQPAPLPVPVPTPSSPAAPAGLSLRTQELTAAFLVVRLFCSFMMEYDIHTILDLLTLVATGAWRAQPRGRGRGRARALPHAASTSTAGTAAPDNRRRRA